MKKKLFITALLGLFLVSGALAQNGTTGDLTWKFENGTLTISGNGAMPDYNYNSFPWYAYRDLITTAVIGDGITSIGNYAFYDCIALASVTIPGSVTSIGSGAFYYCSELASVTIPEGVTSIGDDAFRSCSALASVTILDGVTSIGSNAFTYCSALTSITIPGSVTSIKNHAFTYCSKLASVTIGSGVKSIGTGVFNYCIALVTIDVNAANTAFASDGGILYNKGKTELICYPAGKPGEAFTIPESVTSIGVYSFFNCSALTSVTIPGSVTSIGSGAFYNCSGLTSVTIPEGVTSIGNDAFRSCSALTSLTIPGSVTSIGSGAFYNCSSLTSVAIPEGVTSIGAYAFYYCIALTSVTIPEGVTSIEDYAFYSCSSLTEVNSKNPVPPTITNNTFTDIATSAILYVPVGSVASYAATLWNSFFSGMIQEKDFDADSSVGSVSAGALRVYPNPARDIVTIEGLPAGAVVILYNLTGEVVIESATGKIDISALPSGIYIAAAAGKTVKLVKR